jgi:hypothetical protein
MQTVFCVLPPAMLVYVASVQLAGLLFWGLLFACLARSLVLGKALQLVCLPLCVSPAMSILRGVAVFYSAIPVVFVLVLFLYSVQRPGKLSQLMRSSILLSGMVLSALLYFLASWVYTGTYMAGVRLLDVAAALPAAAIATCDRRSLGPLLLGLLLSGILMAAAMLPQLEASTVNRLGMMMINGHRLGNPIALGLPLALGLIAVLVDEGAWIGAHGRMFTRVLLGVPATGLLALTASRAAWLMVIASLVIVFVFSPGKRMGMLSWVIAGFVVIQLVILTPVGPTVQQGIDRTFGSDRSVGAATSGRSDQWLVASYVFLKSGRYMLTGYGPGRGIEIYARYSGHLPSVQYSAGLPAAWHSLVMQVAVELGLVGLIPLVLWVAAVMLKAVRYLSVTKLAFPLVCAVGYLIVIASVSGLDVISTFMVGIPLSASGISVRAEPSNR